MLLLLIYAFVLLGFWVRALRMIPEHYPNAKEEDVLYWKATLIRAYKLYAILYFFMIIFSLGLGYLLNMVTRATPEITFTTSPLYFQASIVGISLYVTFSLIFIAVRAYKHHMLGKEIGVYAP